MTSATIVSCHLNESGIRTMLRKTCAGGRITRRCGVNGVWHSNLTAMYNMCGSALIDRHSVYYDR